MSYGYEYYTVNVDPNSPILLNLKMQATRSAETLVLTMSTMRHKKSIFGVEFTYPPAVSWSLPRLIFDHENGGDSFLRNVCSHTKYMAVYPRR
jgi:hypothetical protein